MSFVEINWSPSPRQLRHFGVLCLILLPVLGWVWSVHAWLFGIFVGVGALLAVLAFMQPVFIRPIFVALIILASPIGMIISEIAMLLIYFGIFVPIGFAFRLLRRDALQLRIDRQTESYWQQKSEPSDVADYYRQF